MAGSTSFPPDAILRINEQMATLLNSMAAATPTSEPVAPNVVWRDSGVLKLSVGIPPVITLQPQSQTVDVGDPVTFAVTATNATSYQWRRGGVNISGATSASYTIAETVEGDNAAEFDVVVTGLGGTVTSEVATLAVSVVTVTLIYDEQFTIDRAAPMAAHPTTFAANVGNTKFQNPVGASVSGGQLVIANAASLLVIDAATGRDRLAGRIHYCKHPIGTTTDFQSFAPIVLCGESPASNWWALMQGEPGIKFKGGSAGFGDIRNVTGTSDGNYQWKSKVTQEKSYEWAIIERTTGSFSFVRIDGGNWQMITFEKHTTQAAKMHIRNESSGVTHVDRLCTANTSFVPLPLVQHSFASATGPSDGLGQPETGGSGVAATAAGNVTISGASLQMSTDSVGSVVFETGETEIGISADFTIYDGSPCGLILRYQDASNYLMVRVNSTANTTALIEVVAGVETVLASEDSNNGTPDSYNLPDASAIRLQAHVDGNVIRAVYAPGSLHSTFVQHTTTRFAAATKAGVFVSKGAAVNSSKASNFVAFSQVQSLPEMVNT